MASRCPFAMEALHVTLGFAQGRVAATHRDHSDPGTAAWTRARPAARAPGHDRLRGRGPPRTQPRWRQRATGQRTLRGRCDRAESPDSTPRCPRGHTGGERRARSDVRHPESEAGHRRRGPRHPRRLQPAAGAWGAVGRSGDRSVAAVQRPRPRSWRAHPGPGGQPRTVAGPDQRPGEPHRSWSPSRATLPRG